MIFIVILSLLTLLALLSFVLLVGAVDEACSHADGGFLFGILGCVLIVIPSAMWANHCTNQSWENYLHKHKRGEFVQKQGSFGPYLEFQLVPPVLVEDTIEKELSQIEN